MILRQIEENRQEKLIKDEVREQENAAMLTYLEQLQREDYEEAQRRKEKAKILSKELKVANQDMERQKELRKQQDIVADLKVLEYQKEKAARDAAYEAEQERKRLGNVFWSRRIRQLVEELRPVFKWYRLYIGGGNARLIRPKDIAVMGEEIVIVPNTAGVAGGVRAWNLTSVLE